MKALGTCTGDMMSALMMSFSGLRSSFFVWIVGKNLLNLMSSSLENLDFNFPDRTRRWMASPEFSSCCCIFHEPWPLKEFPSAALKDLGSQALCFKPTMFNSHEPTCVAAAAAAVFIQWLAPGSTCAKEGFGSRLQEQHKKVSSSATAFVRVAACSRLVGSFD